MTFNKELAERAVKEIEANPEEWYQGEWRCESGMCFAGYVAHLAGARWLYPNDVNTAMVLTPENHETHVSDFAAEVLGLNLDDGQLGIFDSINSLDKIKALIEEYANKDEEYAVQ